MKNGKRLVSLFLAVMLILCALPFPEAAAANGSQTPTVGSIITLGRYEQNGSKADGPEAIEWLVLAKENGKLLVISRFILERIAYDAPVNDSPDPPAWDDSAVCLWLNNVFINDAFSASERNSIITVTVPNEVRTTRSRLFLLSTREAGAYFRSDAARRSIATTAIYSNNDWGASRAWEFDEYDQLSEEYRDAWLLRPDGDFSECSPYVDRNGEVLEAYGNGLMECINGVRPAMWIEQGAAASGSSRSSTAAPGQTRPYDYQTLKNNVKAFDSSIEMPKQNEMLDDPVTRYVRGSNPNSKSGGMYLCRKPSKSAIDLLSPHSPVTVIAVRGSLAKSTGHAFVETSDGRFGWVAFRATKGLGLTASNDF